MRQKKTKPVKTTYLQAVEHTLSEWNSKEDDNTFKDLQNLLIPYDPVQELANKNFVRKAILECLKHDDFDGILEIIRMHLECINHKTQLKQE